MRLLSHLLALSPILFLAGCSDRFANDSSSSIQIAPSILTRVSDLNFDAGDRIGLTIVRSTGNYVENNPLTYQGSSFVDEHLTWYDTGNEPSTFLAYYPYAETGIDGGFSVATDQRSGYASSDLLAAVKKDVTPTSEPVKMVFYHLLSQLDIVVNNDSSTSVAEVIVSGFVPTADVDLLNQSATVSQDAVADDIVAFEETPDLSYRVILVPQRAPLTVTVHTVDGNTLTKTVSDAALEGGRRYNLSVTLTDKELDMALSGEIGSWEDGGTLVPDDSMGERPEGGEDPDVPGSTLEYEGETYATTVVGGMTWMAENLRYVPDATMVGSTIWYPHGRKEDVAESGMLYSYAAVMGGSSSDALPVQGLCPPGWHVPAKAELETLLAFATVDFISDSGYYMDGSYPSNVSFLVGCDADGSGNCWVVKKKDRKLSLSSVPVGYGFSLRCVKD